MTITIILFILTFVYGPLRLLTRLNIFTVDFKDILNSIINASKVSESWLDSKWLPIQLLGFVVLILEWISTLFFYFALCYQTWYWFHNIWNLI